jgi:ketosteroid isomerase-like protein
VERPEDVRLIEHHVRAFNHGVRTGDWEPMLARFTDDAVMEFPGLALHGRDDIRAGYAERAPDDEVVLLGVQEDVAAFAWSRGGTGRMLFEIDRGAIAKLTVVFDER